MKGYIYIASAFETVNRSACGQKGSWIDNDPHFWTSPPTWGICRNDLRAGAKEGDFVFFVLPRRGRHPQTIFAFLKVLENISHVDAYHRPELLTKRMGNKIPNGNIIVNAEGEYNRFDGGVHKDKFERIKRNYVIGCEAISKMLISSEIQGFAPQFMETLNLILGGHAERPIDSISRKGRRLTSQQVESILEWLKVS